MKKTAILGLCLVAAGSMSAQMSVVKDVQTAIKGGNPDYAAALTQIAPALENEESKGEALTWYVAGKTGFDFYDNLFAKKSLGQDVDGSQLADAILKGYEYYNTAFPLDQVVDAKGKVKTKYTKEMAKTIASHYNDFNQAAVIAWEAKDYPKAYQAWDVWVAIPSNQYLGKEAPTAPADTIVSEIVYNQALAAWQMDDLPLALKTMEKAQSMGYNKKQLYDYGISIAYQLKDNDQLAKFAEEGYKLYGKEDPKYLQLMINSKIEKEQYDDAKKMLEEALQADPDNAQLYNIMGILYESQKDNDTAIKYYKQAIEKDAALANAQYNYGRKLCEQAYAIGDESANLTQTEYNKVRAEKIDPLFKEAAQHLEEAYQLDPDNMSDALRYLKNVYYNLNDEANLKRIEGLL